MNIKACNSDSIPFGACGTVVGCLNEWLEIVYDEPFIGGHTLSGRCQWFRGAI